MSPMTSPAMPPTETAPSSGGRLVSTDGQLLPLRGCSLETDARGGLARVVLRQTFSNDSADPMQATYQMPLPADAAVGAYSFVIGDWRVVGEIDRREAARERFEEAILEGRTAALLEQDRSSVFTQEIGNIPANTEVTCELVLDQKLSWLEDGRWEWRFPTVIAPRYMGDEGRVKDAKRMTVDVAEQELPARATLSMTIRDRITTGEPTSATHPLAIRSDDELTEVAFKPEEGAALDRDIVVRWATAAPEIGVTLQTARPSAALPSSESAYGLLTITPPTPDHAGNAIARDLIILMDTSGSMSGQPLELAKEVALRIIDTLEERDSLELIEFSMDARRWSEAAQPGTPGVRQAASSWVRSLKASGGTEMQSGLKAALRPLRKEAQRQVLLISDGLVGFEHEMVRIVREKAGSGCRVHSIGVGPAANRSLTGAVARAGGGGEFLIDLDEAAGEAASRVVERISKPLCVGVKVGGSAVLDAAIRPIPDLLAGAPSIVPIRLNPLGGDVLLKGRTANRIWKQKIQVGACDTGAGNGSIARLYGRERVEDIELDAAVGEKVDEAIETIGLRFQISTRMTSWVAISEEASVDPREPVRRVRIAQQVPYGMSVEELGLRHPASTAVACHDVLRDDDGHSSRCYEHLGNEKKGIRVTHMKPDPLRKRRREAEMPNSSKNNTLRRAGRETVVRGNLISKKGNRVVIEFEVDLKLEWLPDLVEMQGEPGAILVRHATTKDGVYNTDQTIRVVMKGITTGTDCATKSCTIRMKSGANDVRIDVADSSSTAPQPNPEPEYRVFELARILNVESADIIDLCRNNGISLESHMSCVSTHLQKTIREWLSIEEED